MLGRNSAAPGAYDDHGAPAVATVICLGFMMIPIMPPHETEEVHEQLRRQIIASNERRARRR